MLFAEFTLAVGWI